MSRPQRWRTQSIVLLGVVVLLLIAGGALALRPSRDSNSGINLSVTAEFGAPPTAEQFARSYGLIISGTVTEILPAQWSTPDGKRPVNITPSDVPNSYTIFTPVVVTLDGPPLLNRSGTDVSSGKVVVAAFGGKVGKDEVSTNDPSHHLQVGDHLLIGLKDSSVTGAGDSLTYQTPAGPARSIGMVYHLTESGQAIVAIPNATPAPAQDLIQAIKDAAQTQP